MSTSKSTSLVFIAGLGHSGSTIFDLLLGAQPGITGLGEVDVFLNEKKNDWHLERYDKYNCTCNSIPSECDVWGDFQNILYHRNNLEYGEIYRELVRIAVEKTNSDIIVDSSKNIQALKKVYRSLDQIGISKNRFYVIHLVKDIRSYAASAVRGGRSSGILRSFNEWRQSNQVFENFLKKENIQTICVGYDELSLSTKYLMEQICSFVSEGRIDHISLDLKKNGISYYQWEQHAVVSGRQYLLRFQMVQ